MLRRRARVPRRVLVGGRFHRVPGVQVKDPDPGDRHRPGPGDVGGALQWGGDGPEVTDSPDTVPRCRSTRTKWWGASGTGRSMGRCNAGGSPERRVSVDRPRMGERHRVGLSLLIEVVSDWAAAGRRVVQQRESLHGPGQPVHQARGDGPVHDCCGVGTWVTVLPPVVTLPTPTVRGVFRPCRWKTKGGFRESGNYGRTARRAARLLFVPYRRDPGRTTGRCAGCCEPE